jgi:hypothetical protein
MQVIHSFQATAEDGSEVTIEVWGERVNGAAPDSQRRQLQTEAGETVTKLSDGLYQTSSGAKLKSTDPQRE